MARFNLILLPILLLAFPVSAQLQTSGLFQSSGLFQVSTNAVAMPSLQNSVALNVFDTYDETNCDTSSLGSGVVWCEGFEDGNFVDLSQANACASGGSDHISTNDGWSIEDVNSNYKCSDWTSGDFMFAHTRPTSVIDTDFANYGALGTPSTGSFGWVGNRTTGASRAMNAAKIVRTNGSDEWTAGTGLDHFYLRYFIKPVGVTSLVCDCNSTTLDCDKVTSYPDAGQCPAFTRTELNGRKGFIQVQTVDVIDGSTSGNGWREGASPSSTSTQNQLAYIKAGCNNATSYPATADPLSIASVPDVWYAVQYEWEESSSPGSTDGNVRIWVDDCGESGMDCPSSPTLRQAFTGVDTGIDCVSNLTTLWAYFSDDNVRGEYQIDEIVLADGSVRGSNTPIPFAPNYPGVTVAPPDAPTAPIITEPVDYGDQQFTVAWTHQAPSKVDSYDMRYRCPSGSGLYTTENGAVSPETRTSLTNNVECDVEVRAINVGGASDWDTALVTPSQRVTISSFASSPASPLAVGGESIDISWASDGDDCTSTGSGFDVQSPSTGTPATGSIIGISVTTTTQFTLQCTKTGWVTDNAILNITVPTDVVQEDAAQNIFATFDPLCDTTSPGAGIVFCDGFEDGDWFSAGCEETGSSAACDYYHTSAGTPRPDPANGVVTGANDYTMCNYGTIDPDVADFGAAGTPCTGSKGWVDRASGAESTGGIMDAAHWMFVSAPGTIASSGSDHYSFRFYIKFAGATSAKCTGASGSPPCSSYPFALRGPNGFKGMEFIEGPAAIGGLGLFAFNTWAGGTYPLNDDSNFNLDYGWAQGANYTSSGAALCDDPPGGSCWARNPSNFAGDSSASGYSFDYMNPTYLDQWIAVEIETHAIDGSGLQRIWMQPCGKDGLGCSSSDDQSLVLYAERTGLDLNINGGRDDPRGVWINFWARGQTGEIQIDEMVYKDRSCGGCDSNIGWMDNITP